jgi:uncharacterized protein YpmB
LWTKRSALSYTWKVGTDLLNIDPFSIFFEYNDVTEPIKGSKKASGLHNKDTDLTVFIEKVKEKITAVKVHNGWNRERDGKERY